MTIQELDDRIDCFADLQQGWDTYDAKVIDPAHIEKAHEYLRYFERLKDRPKCYIYPSPNGSIQFEFVGTDFRECEFETTIDSKIEILIDAHKSPSIDIDMVCIVIDNDERNIKRVLEWLMKKESLDAV